MSAASCLKATARALYTALPFKKQLFTALRWFLEPSEAVYQHLHFKGLISVPVQNVRSILIESRGDISENQLFWAGLDGWYERKSIEIWQRLVRQSSVILDIGANSGIYSLVASRLNPDAEIFAFEPVPETFAWLQRNIDVNQFRIVAEPLAASDKNGSAEIWLDAPGSHYGPSLFLAEHKSASDGVRDNVKTVRLDDYFQARGIDRIDLAKIDVERHEPAVLQGMRNLLTKSKPMLLLEVLDDETGRLIERQLEGLGYHFFNIHEPSGSVRKTDHITKADTYNYLCLQPEHLDLAGLDG